jgi:hypothetical protein
MINLPSRGSKCLVEWVVFSVLFTLGNEREYVAAIGEFHELYDVGGVGVKES